MLFNNKSKLEKIELIFIAIGIGAVFLFNNRLPTHYSFGIWIVSLAVVLLAQALLRDLYLLYQSKTQPNTAPAISMRCMCLETMLGLPLIGAGIGIAAIMPHVTFEIPSLVSSLCFSLILIFGFFIKDIVMTWKPFGFRKVKDHSRIHFRF